jgi:2-keto-4-pentenoate hydratase/2-oxohepta-3-ene-1,7-dioic acid hydratase in catechol pathway
MRLVTFRNGGAPRIGAVVGEEVVDLNAADPSLPKEMTALLAAGGPALDAARRAADTARRRLPLAEVSLAAPVLRPPKFFGVGLNYALHVQESGGKAPAVPIIFNKQSTCVTGPRDPIHLPRASQVVDYEGELAFVIGRRCRHVPKARAREVIAGYTVCNDVSVRDWQMRAPTMTMGKSFDTHGPLGPWLVTPDEIGDPHALPLRTWVSGELRQDSNTKEMIFDCFDLVEHLSTAFTLEPGDVVTTGTPSGVGIAMKPPRLLVAGDVVRIEIEGIGRLENPVIPEPADTGRI